MKLQHALASVGKLAQRIVDTSERDSDGNVTVTFSVQDQVSLIVLHRFAKRVLVAKESVRLLHRALTGDDELNQQEMFGPKEGV